MSELVISDAPAGFAAARCLAARVRDAGHWLTTDHPSRCGWCDYPTAELASMVETFNELVAFDLRSGTSVTGIGRFPVDRAEQHRLVTAAQQLEAGPPPAPLAESEATAATAPAPPARPDWLGGER